LSTNSQTPWHSRTIDYLEVSSKIFEGEKRMFSDLNGLVLCISIKNLKSSNILQEKSTITFSSVWPAIKLVNSRTSKLIGLNIYDSSSIGTNNNAKPKEVFAGMKKDSMWNLCFWIQIIFMPTNIEKDKVNVTIKWLIVVKLYGINPIKLRNMQ
jgi:hypothetical protein